MTRVRMRVLPRSPAPVAAVLGVSAFLVGWPGVAHATEEQWRLGGDVGYAMVGLPEGTLGGLLAGAHATYGLTDAYNLRLGADLSAFDRQPPASYALVWSGSVGIEYVVDVLDWIPYVGASVAAMGVYKAEERHDVYFAIEVPMGLGYQPLPELTIGAEFRYRTLIVGSDVGPLSMLAMLGRAEYVFGD